MDRFDLQQERAMEALRAEYESLLDAEPGDPPFTFEEFVAMRRAQPAPIVPSDSDDEEIPF